MTDPAVAHPLTYALGFALVHFVWQGAVIGLVTAALLQVMHRRTPNARYVIGCLGLAAMAVAPVLTAIEDSGRVLLAFPAQPFLTDGGLMFTLPGTTTEAGWPSLWLGSGLGAIEQWLPTLLLLWSLGVLVLMSRLIHGWISVDHVRQGATAVTTGVLRDATVRVSAALGVTQIIRVLRSSSVDAPAVVGWIRPTLLVPASALAGLSVTEMEAVIAHELAHVRRHDYLINGLQHVVETLLFYHPAVWWVSAEIRREREYCCDDVAVSVAASRPDYARALTALEEDRQSSVAFGMSATGGDLLSRIQRVLGQPSRRRQAPSLALVVGGVVMVMAVVTAATGANAHLPVPALSAAHADVALPRATGGSTSAPAIPQSSSTRQTDESQVLALEEQYRRAKLENDTATLARLMDSGFIGTNQTGALRDKALSLELWKTFKVLSLTVDAAEVRVLESVAVVTGFQTEATGSGTDRMLFTRVWKRSASGTWTLVSNSQFLDPGSAAPVAGMVAPPRPSELDGLHRRLEALEAERRSQISVPLRAGQNGVAAPRKIADKRPVYPQEAKDAGLTGLVVTEATIDVEGNVKNLQVVRSAGALLDQAARDAVSEWKFTPTLLNGVPTEVVVVLTVNFTLSR